MGSTSTSPGTVPPPVLDLDDPRSRDPQVTGAKGAVLAQSRHAGLPVLDGFVIPVDVARRVAAAARGGGTLPDAVDGPLRAAWRRLVADGRPVVVRSSSPHEDGSSSSMAGQFHSVLDVTGWDAFLEAVAQVVDSAGGGPMAVLVQPFIRPEFGGVLFGADPVTGRTDRLVVSAVPGGPHRLVSGEVDGTQITLSPRGRLLDDAAHGPRRDGAPDCGGAASTSRRRGGAGCAARSSRRRLAHLARDAAHVFGGPQDIEWAVLEGGRLVLLQSRPITTLGAEVEPSGPVLGPGPVAETFPRPLAALEDDLWIPPLRDGIRRALALTGAVAPRQLRTSPVVTTVHGHVAADLELLGVAPRRRSLWRTLDPRPPARRLGAAWRVGRLRAALPGLATDVLSTVDGHLAEVPPLSALTPGELLRILERSGDELVSLHGYEVLAGQLLDAGADAPTGASAALRVLADARTREPDTPDGELVARYPVLLALVPPAIEDDSPLPAMPAALTGSAATATGGAPDAHQARRAPTAEGHVDPGVVREALRLRIRWVHELSARAALALGHGLVERGVLTRAADVRYMPLVDLRAAVSAGPAEAAALAPDVARASRTAAPLPAAFRLSANEVVVPIATPSDAAAQGAGGGRGSGPVHKRPPVTGTPDATSGEHPDVPEGAVLVVPTLDPSLAPLLPRLGGLVAETGSVLSHLAILAREFGVPTVVGLPGASERFAEGTWVVVDGTSGTVETVGDEEWRAA